MAYPQHRFTIGVTRARQGRPGGNLLWVLVLGVVLTVLGFAVTWAWKAADLAAVQPGKAAQRAAAQSFSATPPASTLRQDVGRPASEPS